MGVAMQHLEGIKVINEYMTYSAPFWSIFIVFSAILFYLISMVIISKHPKVAITFGILMVLAIAASYICIYFCQVENGMVYECTISDDITYTELTNVYKIVGYHGNIYKLKFLEG